MSHNNSKQLAFILFVLFIEQILEYDYKFEAYNKPNCFSRFAYRLEFESYVFLMFVIWIGFRFRQSAATHGIAINYIHWMKWMICLV